MRTLLRGTHPLEVCREVIARALHPEEVDVDTGDRIRPLVLDDRHHLLTWIRLYSRCLAARNLFLAGAIDRCRWEIGAALVAAADSPCYLDEVYLAELRDCCAPRTMLSWPARPRSNTTARTSTSRWPRTFASPA